MGIEEAIKEAYEVDGDMSPRFGREIVMIFIDLAKNIRKVANRMWHYHQAKTLQVWFKEKK